MKQWNANRASNEETCRKADVELDKLQSGDGGPENEKRIAAAEAKYDKAIERLKSDFLLLSAALPQCRAELDKCRAELKECNARLDGDNAGLDGGKGREAGLLAPALRAQRRLAE